jgi:hypothetical protein
LKGRRPRAEAGEPVQPRLNVSVIEQEADGRTFEPRGVLWLGGKATDVAGFNPLVRRAGIMSLDAPYGADAVTDFDEEGWHPAVPVALRVLPRGGEAAAVLFSRSEGRLLLTLGQYRSEGSMQRLLEETFADVYYSAADDIDPPTITSVEERPASGDSVLGVAVEDPSGIIRVVATWTGDEASWQSVELVREDGSDLWTGRLPRGAVAVVQAVDGAGNVAIADNDGAMYGTASSAD